MAIVVYRHYTISSFLFIHFFEKILGSPLPEARRVSNMVPGGRFRLQDRSRDVDSSGITMLPSYSMYLKKKPTNDDRKMRKTWTRKKKEAKISWKTVK